MSQPRPCYICGRAVLVHPAPERREQVLCKRCGTYELTERDLQRILEGWLDRNDAPRYLISAAIRERWEGNLEPVVVEDLPGLTATLEPLQNPFEALDKILLHIGRKSERAGAKYDFDVENDYPLAFARDAQEFGYFLELARTLNLTEGKSDSRVRLAPAGWERLSQLLRYTPRRDAAFVAMNFAPDLQPAFDEGIKRALRCTGYEAIRVDRIEHNSKIDDVVLAGIRSSELVVADFTGQRQNAYFEAGFALGLGRHVIWTCRQGEEGKLHLDTRQYNHIFWRDPDDLRARLVARILATIPGRALADDTDCANGVLTSSLKCNTRGVCSQFCS